MKRYYRIEGPGAKPVLAERSGGAYRTAEIPERFSGLVPQVFAEVAPGRVLGEVEELDELAPTKPSKIVCVGRNYRRHAEELGNPLPEDPLIFLKPASALVGPGATIRLPDASEEVHHEAELAVVISRRASDVGPERALDHVAGYTCANDVTARDIQRRESAFSRAKGYDTFCPAGPSLVSADLFEVHDHGLSCRVEGEERQRANFDDLIFSIPEILTFITGVMTLEPGDLVLTGTPSGVGPIQPGETVEVTVEPIGTLSNSVGPR